MAKKLSSKANYVPKRNIKSVTIKRNKKETEVSGKNVFDGTYVKKGVKYSKGGTLEGRLDVDNIGFGLSSSQKKSVNFSRGGRVAKKEAKNICSPFFWMSK